MNYRRPLSKQPLPHHAKKAFSGRVFDVYQWEQKMFDGSTETFEKIKRSDTVNVIPITKEGKLILSRQEQPGRQPYIGALGGKIDDGETPLEAVKRELLEEAGMVADTLTLWKAEQLLDKVDWAMYTYIAKRCRKVQEPTLDSGEIIVLFEATFDEFLDIVAQEEYRDFEIALRVFRTIKNGKELKRMRKLFMP